MGSDIQVESGYLLNYKTNSIYTYVPNSGQICQSSWIVGYPGLFYVVITEKQG